MHHHPPHQSDLRELWDELRVVGDFDVAMRNPVIRRILSRAAARRAYMLRQSPPRGGAVGPWQDA